MLEAFMTFKGQRLVAVYGKWELERASPSVFLCCGLVGNSRLEEP